MRYLPFKETRKVVERVIYLKEPNVEMQECKFYGITGTRCEGDYIIRVIKSMIQLPNPHTEVASWNKVVESGLLIMPTCIVQLKIHRFVRDTVEF